MIFSTSAVAVCCSSASVELAVARLDLVEQARVLDGDRGLVGEGRDKLDLALRERNRLLAREREGADGFAISHERHAEHRPYFARRRISSFSAYVRIAPCVLDLDRPILLSDASDQCPRGRP